MKASCRSAAATAGSTSACRTSCGTRNTRISLDSPSRRRRSADVVKPVFGLGAIAEKPYNYPRPLGLTAGLNAQGGLISGRAKADLLDPDIDTAYLDNWFVGVQRAVGSNMAVEADYIGSRGNNMYIRYNVNRFSGDLFDGTVRRHHSGRVESSARTGGGQEPLSRHDARVEGQRSGVQFGTAYTFGKAIDFSSTSTPTGARQDPFGPEDQDEGPSDFDIRHKLSASLNWMLPGPSSGIAANVLGGWQVGTRAHRADRQSVQRHLQRRRRLRRFATRRAPSSATPGATTTRTTSRTTGRTCRRSERHDPV